MGQEILRLLKNAGSLLFPKLSLFAPDSRFVKISIIGDMQLALELGSKSVVHFPSNEKL